MPPDNERNSTHDPKVSLMRYLELKFDGLEKHIDDKFGFQHEINRDYDKRLCHLETTLIPQNNEKISTVARRGAYVDGALGVIVAIVLFLMSRT